MLLEEELVGAVTIIGPYKIDKCFNNFGFSRATFTSKKKFQLLARLVHQQKMNF
jgi:hypothetical protein